MQAEPPVMSSLVTEVAACNVLKRWKNILIAVPGEGYSSKVLVTSDAAESLFAKGLVEIDLDSAGSTSCTFKSDVPLQSAVRALIHVLPVDTATRLAKKFKWEQYIESFSAPGSGASSSDAPAAKMPRFR